MKITAKLHPIDHCINKAKLSGFETVELAGFVVFKRMKRPFFGGAVEKNCFGQEMPFDSIELKRLFQENVPFLFVGDS